MYTQRPRCVLQVKHLYVFAYFAYYVLTFLTPSSNYIPAAMEWCFRHEQTLADVQTYYLQRPTERSGGVLNENEYVFKLLIPKEWHFISVSHPVSLNNYLFMIYTLIYHVGSKLYNAIEWYLITVMCSVQIAVRKISCSFSIVHWIIQIDTNDGSSLMFVLLL